MRRAERVTDQGPVKEQQPDGMSHREGGGDGMPCWPSLRVGPSEAWQQLQITANVWKTPPPPRDAHRKMTSASHGSVCHTHVCPPPPPPPPQFASPSWPPPDTRCRALSVAGQGAQHGRQGRGGFESAGVPPSESNLLPSFLSHCQILSDVFCFYCIHFYLYYSDLLFYFFRRFLRF